MAEALQVSRSSISTNLKTLQMSELVEKVSLPGERVDYYVFSPEGWQRALEMRLSSIFDLKELAVQGLDDLPEDHPAHPRLVEMGEWVDMVQQAVNKLTEEWQSRREVTAS
jgi:DNA-binding transcriptional regulator GbsR (MarR family)